MSKLYGKTRTYRELQTHTDARRRARDVSTPAQDAVRLRARVEQDPGNPAHWARYCVHVEDVLQRSKKPRREIPPAGRAPLADVLVLSGSGLQPDQLWSGSTPSYPPDRPESDEDVPGE